MPVVSGVPGVLDTRQGFAGQPYPPELVEQLERQKEARGRVKHPAEIAAEKAESERRREAERRAANPDPRQSLRAAHAKHHAAAAELDRIVGLREKAGELLATLEGEHAALTDKVRASNEVAAGRLVVALAEGTDLPFRLRKLVDETESFWPAPTPPNDVSEAQLDEVAARLQVARGAVSQLSEHHAAALKAVLAAARDVQVAVYGLGVDHAVAEAEAIEELAAALNARRAELWSLSAALTTAGRSLGPGAVPGLPPAVGRAIGAAADHRTIDPAWDVRLARLREDPEAELA
jgi:hypothetical protein